MSWRVWRVGVAAALSLLLSACASVRGRPADGPVDEAEAYLRAWAANDVAAMKRAVAGPPASFEEQHQRFRDGLRIVSSRFELGRVERDGEQARATFRAVHVLRGLGEWELESTLPFVRREGRWFVRWTPAVLHPEAREGDRYSRTRTWLERAELLDAYGEPLTHVGEVITIGVDPTRVRSRADVTSALQVQLEVDPARVEKALNATGATAANFVPIIDVRPERYQLVRPALAPVPGIFFRKKTARLSPSEGFASHTLGRVGEVTAELLAQLGPLYQPGDIVGLSGLERAFEPQLAGTPSGEVVLTRPSGEAQVVFRFEGKQGTPLTTTLRPALQMAAEAALEGVTQPAALVAVDSESGAVLAIASRPLSQPLHRALTGRYPPGSTFKVVTTEALLARGMGVDAPAPCPPTVAVKGKSFRNFEDEALGAITLRGAFAHSCNTAFVLLSANLGGEALGEAARRFGFDVEYHPGLPSSGGTFPAPRNAVELAASSIGQGRVLATPLHLASVAAAAESGRWRAPYLVTDLDDGPSASLADGTRGALHLLMRAVVTEGTGRAAAGVPELAGKTGTAEFGTVPPLPTHAWFIGFRNGIAFAVLVEGGGVGGRVAAPIAARFASAL
ncbi:penicillin-binding transpeptidase domain-containing protein [Pyxidicoccus caerfyrddinensis]|uniref:penicillin-binding transpeptidase domain-containing protein n=1 Tax=Pyxidicoccus caerfyrddinensis TaxID=2709663 RepID=UPI0013DABD38|nr:penicillin-binding transpeptidase domain-containing protein [Pyxidicoccus caerfyrddinensis]